MTSLVRLCAFNSYLLATLAGGALLLALLTRNGLSTVDLGWVGLYAAATVAVLIRRRVPAARLANLTDLAAFDRALRGERPTLLALWSQRCGFCLLARPELDRLERATTTRLQVLRVDVHSPIGAQLADRYDVIATPAFLLFSANGVREGSFALTLDRARVRYWLDQQTITP